MIEINDYINQIKCIKDLIGEKKRELVLLEGDLEHTLRKIKEVLIKERLTEFLIVDINNLLKSFKDG